MNGYKSVLTRFMHFLLICILLFPILLAASPDKTEASGGYAQLRIRPKYDMARVRVIGHDQNDQLSIWDRTLNFPIGPGLELYVDDWWWEMREFCLFCEPGLGPLVHVYYTDGHEETVWVDASDLGYFDDVFVLHLTYEGGDPVDPPPDCDPPQITVSPSASVSSVASNIGWGTDSASSTEVVIESGKHIGSPAYYFNADSTYHTASFSGLYPGVGYRAQVRSCNACGCDQQFVNFTTRNGRMKVNLIDLDAAAQGNYQPVEAIIVNTFYPGAGSIFTGHSHWYESSFGGPDPGISAAIGVQAEVNLAFNGHSDSWVSTASLAYINDINYSLAVKYGGIARNPWFNRTAISSDIIAGTDEYIFIPPLVTTANGITYWSYIPPNGQGRLVQDEITVSLESTSEGIYSDDQLMVYIYPNLVAEGCFHVGSSVELRPSLHDRTGRLCNGYGTISDEEYARLGDDFARANEIKEKKDRLEAEQEFWLNLLGLPVGVLFGARLQTIIDMAQATLSIYQTSQSLQNWTNLATSGDLTITDGSDHPNGLFGIRPADVVTYQVYSLSGAVQKGYSAEPTNNSIGIFTHPRLYYVLAQIRRPSETTSFLSTSIYTSPPQWLIQAGNVRFYEPDCPQCNKFLIESRSPVHYWLETSEGLRFGTLADGTFVNDGVDGNFYTYPELDGSTGEVMSVPQQTYTLHMAGLADNDTFSIILSQDRGTHFVGVNYLDVPTSNGQEFSVVLPRIQPELGIYANPLILPDGTLHWPTDYDAPETLFHPDPDPPPVRGWYNEDVPVTLEAIDDVTGPDFITYRVNGGEWATYSAQFWITEERVDNLIEAYSQDMVGNVEDPAATHTIKLDKTDPVSTIACDGPQLGDDNPWYHGAVTCNLDATDSLSGVWAKYYQIDDGPRLTTDQTFQVTTDGKHIITYMAEDVAGNVEAAHTIDIWVDTTPPDIDADVVVEPAQITRTDYFAPTFSAEDALSGVNYVMAWLQAPLVDGADGRTEQDANEPPVDERGVITGLVSGAGVDILWLESGANELVVAARDMAGTERVVRVPFEVIATPDSLREAIERFRAERGIKAGQMGRLRRILNDAQTAWNEGRFLDVIDHLEVFRDHVAAQRDRGINAQVADLLLADADYVIAGLKVTPDSPALLAPPHEQITGDPDVVFSWEPVADATDYQIQIDTGAGFDDPDQFTVSATEYAATLADGHYYWRVRSLRGDLVGPWSAARYLVVSTAAPAGPELRRPNDGKGTANAQPVLKWEPVPRTVQYRVQIATTPGFDTPLVDETTTTNRYIPAALAPNTYYWRVQVIDYAGNVSQWSDTWRFSVTIMRTPMDGWVSTAARPTFRWRAMDGAEGYQLQIARDADFTDIVLEIERGKGSRRHDLTRAQALATGIYYWRVNVKQGGAWTVFPVAWEFTITPPRPDRPTGLLPPNRTLTTDDTPSLSWDAVPGATTYDVVIASDGRFRTIVQQHTTAATTITLSALPDGRYFWHVRAVNEYDVAGRWSARRVLHIDTTPPAAPSARTPRPDSVVHTRTPLLRWNADKGTAHHRVQVATDAGFTDIVFEQEATRNRRRVPTADALPYGSYYWRVQSRDKAGNWSAWSDAWAFEITLLRAPVEGGVLTTHQPRFQWYRDPDAQGYRVDVALDSAFNTIVWQAETDSRTRDYQVPAADALPDGHYYWRVAIQTGSGWEPLPHGWAFAVTPPPPAPPELLFPSDRTATNDNTLVFSWLAVTGASDYHIQISADAHFRDLKHDFITTRTDFEANALADGAYYWRVAARNDLDVAGRWSKIFRVTVDTIAPPAPTLRSPVDGADMTTARPVLRWTRVESAVTYEVQIGEGAEPDHIVAQTGKRWWRPLADLPPRTYRWRVRALDAAGNVSNWSDTFTLTLTSARKDRPERNRYTTATPLLAWDAISWAQAYQIQVDDDPRFRSPAFDQVTGSLQSMPTLAEGKWYWRVRAQRADGTWGGWSSSDSFIIDLP